MAKYIHGEMRSFETERLEFMAGFCAPAILRNVTHLPKSTVLDVGCGVGAMTYQLAKRYPDIRLVGVDLQIAALRTAKSSHAVAMYAQTDAVRLPFADGTFDGVHGSWVLEHTPNPLQVIQEVHRVLKPGGQCCFIEVDNSSFKIVPAYPEVITVMNALNRKQVEGQGDPYIGQKLSQLLSSVGFTQVKTWTEHYQGSAKDPTTFDALTRIFGDIFESVTDALGVDMEPQVRNATQKIRLLKSVTNGTMHYSPVIALAIK